MNPAFDRSRYIPTDAETEEERESSRFIDELVELAVRLADDLQNIKLEPPELKRSYKRGLRLYFRRADAVGPARKYYFGSLPYHMAKHLLGPTEDERRRRAAPAKGKNPRYEHKHTSLNASHFMAIKVAEAIASGGGLRCLQGAEAKNQKSPPVPQAEEEPYDL